MATIMVIEDCVIYRELLRELCESEGHEVMECTSAEEALSVLRHFDEFDVHSRRRRIDLFISDFHMDGMNGYEFIREMRGLADMRDVPVVMISSTAKDFKDLLKLDNIAFLSKPCSNSSVIATVSKLLQAGAAPRGEPPESARPPARPNSAAQVTRLLDSMFSTHPTMMALPSAPAAGGAALLLPKLPPSAQAAVPFPHNHIAAPSPQMAFPAAPAAESALLPPMPPSPPHPPAPPTETPTETPRPAARPEFSEIDEGVKSSISQSARLTEFLISRQKPARDSSGVFSQASSPVADLVEKILGGAIRRGASDIHIEPQLGSVEVRARVDGVLQRLVSLPSSVAENMAARIKILCGLNITEKRLPQDGQFAWRSAEGAAGKFRVSTLPSLHGEKLVLRVLPSGTLGIKLDALGFTSEELARVRDILRSPNGLMLATGPTGSGKTTTLYTLLDGLNTSERNIVTVEDPIEYQLPGITQVQVNAGIGYTFERVLRSFLRQDPNVILIGEVRDSETAEIALKAAVTGHLVLSTLHTNDAVGAVHRLLSMGLPAYIVAAAVRLVIAQRLVRTLCPRCRVPSALSPEEACALSPEEVAALSQVWRPKGCAACHGIGYCGRRPVYEILTVASGAMRLAVAKGTSPEELKVLAVGEGMVPMRRKALQYVAEGIISIEEALVVMFV